MNKRKKILFISGTRADYGKIKSLMLAIEKLKNFELYIFVCGMHLYKRYGYTCEEIIKDGYKNIYIAKELKNIKSLSKKHGKTICSLDNYVKRIEPDLIVVHGDRMDALAGATVGALNNILVGHIEGGELSGTIDESIRHAISKFAHAHFVCNKEAYNRLVQMGEEKNRIYIIGSPDIDIMLSNKLPNLFETKNRYHILFEKYAILMYHPVTTELSKLKQNCKQIVSAIIKSNLNYIVIFPNNDLGSDIILHEYQKLINNEHIKIFPSLRFEYFLTLLKNSDFIIGNSSAGIRESSVYGIPAIDIGNRQSNRYSVNELKNVIHTDEITKNILKSIEIVDMHNYKVSLYGNGDSTKKFINIINKKSFWNLKIQKQFVELDM